MFGGSNWVCLESNDLSLQRRTDYYISNCELRDGSWVSKVPSRVVMSLFTFGTEACVYRKDNLDNLLGHYTSACLQRSIPNLCRQCTFHLKCMATCCDSCLASRWGLEEHRLLSGVLFIDVHCQAIYAEIFRIVHLNCVTLNFKISKLHDFFGTMFFCSLIISGFGCTIHTSPQLPLGSLELAGLVRPVTGSPAVRSFLDDASSSIFIVIILRQSRQPVLGWRLCGCHRHQNQQQQQQQQENISNHSQAPLH